MPMRRYRIPKSKSRSFDYALRLAKRLGNVQGDESGYWQVRSSVDLLWTPFNLVCETLRSKERAEQLYDEKEDLLESVRSYLHAGESKSQFKIVGAHSDLRESIVFFRDLLPEEHEIS